MRRILAVIAGLLMLSGCATVPKLSASDADRVKSGKTAILFVDDVEQINYLQDKYYVLAVTQEGSTSVYKGIWNSSKELSAVHADEFSKLGLKATSAYDLLVEEDLARLTQHDRQRYTIRAAQPDNGAASADAVASELRQALLDKGQDYLIWSSWSGYTLHIQTLGLPANQQFLCRYWIFDLRGNKFLGGGDQMWLQKLDLAGATGKDFLEKDNLAGLRSEVEKLIRTRFESPANARTGKVLGLESAT